MEKLKNITEDNESYVKNITCTIIDKYDGHELVTFKSISLLCLITLTCTSFENGYGIKATRGLTKEELEYYDSIFSEESNAEEEKSDAEAKLGLGEDKPGDNESLAVAGEAVRQEECMGRPDSDGKS